MLLLLQRPTCGARAIAAGMPPGRDGAGPQRPGSGDDAAGPPRLRPGGPRTVTDVTASVVASASVAADRQRMPRRDPRYANLTTAPLLEPSRSLVPGP